MTRDDIIRLAQEACKPDAPFRQYVGNVKVHAKANIFNNVKKYVDLAKKKDSGFRLMGFGHRVYKNYDPRAKLIKATCDRLLAKLSLRDPIFDIAQQLEAVALADEYFIERKLYPNVDFYSGVIYRAMGIPVQMFTVLFAMGRLPGWIAHWMEMHRSPTKKICRPRQIYSGETLREFQPIDRRG